MSETVDVNVLVYATDELSPRHEPARELVARLGIGPGLVYLFWPVVIGYLRIATLPAASPNPLRPAEAQGNVEVLLSRPHIRAVSEGENFWQSYQTVSAGVTVRGNLVWDAHLAALMIQHGVATIWSYDRDFRKFSGITVREP